MAKTVTTSTKKTPPIGAGVAGASGGTGILAMVSAIPDTSQWKPILTFASPTVAVAITAIYVFTTSIFEKWLADRSLASELTKADDALREIEADPKSSETLKTNARTKVEALRLLKLTLHTNRAQAIVDV